jgi:lipopolysaccharide transport system ATP-binding protein
MNDVAISVRNVRKAYRIWSNPSARLKAPLWDSLGRLLPRNGALAGRCFSKAAAYFRDFYALKDISFEVRKGESLGIIGRNGSGKSTLLQIIAGTLQPTEGEVDVNGRVAALLELGSGFNPEFTGRENVYMNAAILGLTREQTNARFDAIASFADIGDFIEQPVKIYSTGMVVRLAFAVATSVEADTVIIDEAMAVGDVSFQNRCHRRLEQLRQDGVTILFVSHSPGQVLTLSERAIWIHQGELRRIGEVDEVARAYAYFMHDGYDETKARQNSGTGKNKAERSGHGWIRNFPRANIDARPGFDIAAIRLTDLDSGSSLTPITQYGTRARVEVVFTTEAPIRNPLIGIGLFDAADQPVFHFNTASLEFFPKPITMPGKYLFTADFVVPDIRDGDYGLSLGLDDGFPDHSLILCHGHALLPVHIACSSTTYRQYGLVRTSVIKATLAEMEESDGEPIVPPQ